MKRNVTIHERSQLQSWSSIARSVFDNVKNREIFVNCNDSSTFLRESECIRAISETVEESPIRNLFLKCAIDVERQSPGSSYVALSMVSESNVQFQHGRKFQLQQLRDSLNVLIGVNCADIVMDAVSLAGRKGKILLDPTESQITEISYGTQVCKWKPDVSYFAALGQMKASVQDCRVVFIDGIIESVAECHKIFHDSYEKKTPVVVFARGFAEEVVATAAINMQRRTAQVIPIVIPFDEVGVNGMSDVASCFSAELVSSDKGHLISSVDIDSCVRSKRITCSSSGTEIEFYINSTSHVTQRLISKLKDCDQQQADLIRRRLDALGSNAVSIRIGNETKSLRGIQRDRIDFGLRYVKSCMQHGVTSFEGIMLPARSVKLGLECLRSFRNIVESSRVTLEIDKCG